MDSTNKQLHQYIKLNDTPPTTKLLQKNLPIDQQKKRKEICSLDGERVSAICYISFFFCVKIILISFTKLYTLYLI